jgi:hypothetical protein
VTRAGGELDEDVVYVIAVAGKAAGLSKLLDVVGDSPLVSRNVGNGTDVLEKGEDRGGLKAGENTVGRHRNLLVI